MKCLRDVRQCLPPPVRPTFHSAGQEFSSRSSTVFRFPPSLVTGDVTTACSGDMTRQVVTRVMEYEGHLRLQLRAGVILDIAHNQTLRLNNTRQDSSMTVSCSSQL